MNINIYAKYDKIPNKVNQDMQEKKKKKKKFSRPTKGYNCRSIDLWTQILCSQHHINIIIYGKYDKIPITNKQVRQDNKSVMDNF